MPSIKFIRESEVERTPRVVQLEGMFDIEPALKSREEWDVDLPFDDFDWNIGVIVGPSGCGKSSLAAELFGDKIAQDYKWDPKKSIVDSFPKSMSIKEVTNLLSSVGFC